ncbi:putative membrane protein [Arthrobacter sp. UYEF36]
MLVGRGPARSDTDTSIQGEGPYYALGMPAAADSPSRDIIYIPALPSTRFYAGALALLSVLQYFVAEAAVIGAWAGQQPYSRRTGYISDLGAVGCGVFDGRDVCSPAHVLMNASFVVQGIGMMVGALLLSSALLCTAARPGIRFALAPASRATWAAALAARALTALAGAGTVLVGLVPEDAGSVWHVVGAILYFAAGGVALVLLGWIWLRQTALSWLILACGLASLGALVAGGVTGMDVPEPGTLERVMGYPITIGTAAVGLVVAQRVGRERSVLRAAHAGGAARRLPQES